MRSNGQYSNRTAKAKEGKQRVNKRKKIQGECGASLLATHIKSLNDTVPNNVRANPSLALHNAMVIYSHVPRPKTAACLRVRIRCVVF